MGHERDCSALAPGRPTCGSHHHYQSMDRAIMPLMEGNSEHVWRRPKIVTVCCMSAGTCDSGNGRKYKSLSVLSLFIILHIYIGRGVFMGKRTQEGDRNAITAKANHSICQPNHSLPPCFSWCRLVSQGDFLTTTTKKTFLLSRCLMRQLS